MIVLNKRHISKILRDLEQKRSTNEQILTDRKLAIYKQIPELFEIDKKMRSNAAKTALMAVLLRSS